MDELLYFGVIRKGEKMILYHGSNVIVDNPRIIESTHPKDFGTGFYLTPIKSQAERMALRKIKIENGKAIVSVFEWNEISRESLKCKAFPEANYEWLDLIVKCRIDVNYKHGFDIVEGKIADDSVGETILFVIDGVMRKEDALERLKFQKINSQIAFCSERSLCSLTFLRSYEVK